MNTADALLRLDSAKGDAKWSGTENVVSAAFVGAMLVVVLIGVLGAGALRRSEKSEKWVEHTYLVLRTIDEVKSGLFEAIADTGAFILTGIPDSLEQREKALSEVESRLQNSRELVADNPDQGRAIGELARLIDARVDLDRAAIVAAQTNGIGAAKDLMAAAGSEGDLTGRIRGQFETIRATELKLLDTRQRADQKPRRQVMWLAGTLFAAVVATVLIGLMKLRRELALRHDLANSLRANRGFLAIVLDNLPAMIFVKDVRTLRYLTVNLAAEAWLGLPREAIVGRTASEFMTAENAEFADRSDRETLAHSDALHIPQDQRIDRDGAVYTFATRKLLVRDAAGKPLYLVSISHDISERVAQESRIKILNHNLGRQQSELEAANRELESFSYSVSHDLRSPLRAVDGFSLMLLEDYGDKLEPEARRYLDTIRHASQRMSQLIDDLLAFSRLGRQSLAHALVDMEALATSAVQEALQGADSAQRQVTIDRLPAARGDPSLLAQVWSNLVSNAVKYTGKTNAPKIEIGARTEGNEISYYVRDNGAGFDMQYAHKLFGVFQRLHGQEEFSGTGVGLAIVHRVVTRHGGRVWAEGTPGRGATFHFALPTEAAA
ncbi:MAG TPA: ATP-binding protein [Steroidobacteraceae bacterium]|jgi:PAS domain S-box-containing protein|nr:ATP-binding protein [Steroidobacteraceae bacterium]